MASCRVWFTTRSHPPCTSPPTCRVRLHPLLPPYSYNHGFWSENANLILINVSSVSLSGFGFNGLWRFAGPFSKVSRHNSFNSLAYGRFIVSVRKLHSLCQQQTQFPDYAELIVKFLDALIDTYLPGIDEETSEECLRTPTSPYPPPGQSQLSITANLNLSNSMTSLATSQHSPGLHTHTVHTHRNSQI